VQRHWRLSAVCSIETTTTKEYQRLLKLRPFRPVRHVTSRDTSCYHGDITCQFTWSLDHPLYVPRAETTRERRHTNVRPFIQLLASFATFDSQVSVPGISGNLSLNKASRYIAMTPRRLNRLTCQHLLPQRDIQSTKELDLDSVFK